MKKKRDQEQLIKMMGEAKIDQRARRRQRFANSMAKRSLEHYQAKYGKSPQEVLRIIDGHHNMSAIQSEQDAELEDLFDSVVDEIEERQIHMEKLGDQMDKPTQERYKNEICERIAEL